MRQINLRLEAERYRREGPRKSSRKPDPSWRFKVVLLIAVVVFVIVIATLAVLSGAALAHDSWISRGGHRNAAGEWCCGEGDCFVVTAQHVTSPEPGYRVFLPTGIEFIPERDAQPSPDGAYWRCRRPDGSRRCFFAPPPNT